jgi:hypothetical protein
MNQMAIHYGVLIMRARDAAARRLTEDRGEISSWLILAAGLALVAIFIGDELFSWAEERIEQITESGNSNAN